MNNMHYERECGWSCKKVVEMDVRIVCGVLEDLARSSRVNELNHRNLKRVTFVFRPGHLQGIWREYRVYEGKY